MAGGQSNPGKCGGETLHGRPREREAIGKTRETKYNQRDLREKGTQQGQVGNGYLPEGPIETQRRTQKTGMGDRG